VPIAAECPLFAKASKPKISPHAHFVAQLNIKHYRQVLAGETEESKRSMIVT
jgi:hypothetical protein